MNERSSNTQKTIKTRSGRVVELPTTKENAAIKASIAADPDTHELSDAEFARLPVRGRPLGRDSKIQVKLRLDIDVVEKLNESPRL